MKRQKKYYRNTPLLVGAILFGILLLLVFFRELAPGSNIHWSHSTLLNKLFILCLGVCISIICSVPAYFAWRLPQKDFIEWYAAQALVSNPRLKQPLSGVLSDEYFIWINRLVIPIIGITTIAAILRFVF